MAIRWQGRFYLPTDLTPKGNGQYLWVQAGEIEPRNCWVKRNAGQRDNLNRPTDSWKDVAVFPGVVVEKWMGYTQSTLSLIHI